MIHDMLKELMLNHYGINSDQVSIIKEGVRLNVDKLKGILF